MHKFILKFVDQLIVNLQQDVSLVLYLNQLIFKMKVQDQLQNINQACSFLNSSNPSLQNQQQIKYHALYKDYSSTRNQLRGYKHQNSWLLNIKKGLQQQNCILKDALKQKKDVILNLNQEIKLVNKEVSRLQDQLYQKSRQLSKCETQYQLISKENAQLLQTNRRNQVQHKILIQKEQNLKKNLQNDKKNISDVLSNIIKLIMSKLRKQFVVQSLDQSGQIQKIQFSKIQQQINTGFLLYQKQTQNKLETQHNIRYVVLESELQQLRRKEQNILQQLSQAANLLDNQNQRHNASNLQSESIKSELQTLKKHNSKLKNAINKISNIYFKTISLLKKIVPQELISFVKTQSEKLTNKQNIDQASIFKQSVYFEQLQNFCDKLQLKQKRQGMILNDYYENKNVNTEKVQQFQLAKLKLIILQRQYNEILEDNRRLIKFNNLSQYRLQRNYQKQQKMLTSKLVRTRIQKSIIEDSNERNNYFKMNRNFQDKQNILNSINIGKQQKELRCQDTQE